MAGFSDFAERSILRQLFRNTTALQPTNVYVALWIGDPTDTGAGGAEVTTTGTAYARVAVSTGTSGTGAGSGWTDPGASGAISTSNNAVITFATPAGSNWGTVTHAALMDAVTAGNMISSSALTTSRTINVGDSPPSFAIGALVFSLD
jgi:hypothetical protein